ncbi:MAG: hypothetical protein JXM79_24940 [Sedimentisphaerales bacterium]|nr:hypothetical protein [Sedimentisphaerales bacterium]
MKTRNLHCQIKHYIQPFEKKLAISELSSLCGTDIEAIEFRQDSSIVSAKSMVSSKRLASKLAYWEYVFDRKPLPTQQILNEATVNVIRNGVPLENILQQLPFKGDLPLPNRRCLRYGPHGIHEYKGKFFPQLVVSLLNIAKVPKKALVADPMCGSGTVLVESVLAGHKGIGLDMNPLSVYITATKCSLLSVNPGELSRTYNDTRVELLRTKPRTSPVGPSYFESLSKEDQRYIEKWFSQQVLDELDRITDVIACQSEGPCKNLLWLSLSNILRRVSWQKEEDLRVRKEVKSDFDIDPIREFLEDLGRSVRMVLALRLQRGVEGLGSFTVKEGDARTLNNTWERFAGKVDVVITSPPYATALPYIDTDRLSLMYLKLLSRRDHKLRDQIMIGNREITEKKRTALLEFFNEHKSLLPDKIVRLIMQISQLNENSKVGFRRLNLPALLAKYFFDMREVLFSIKALLKPQGRAYVVIGSNHTVAGGQRIEINTAELLANLADESGLICEDQVPMEMLISRGIFRRNAVASECILCLKKTQT